MSPLYVLSSPETMADDKSLQKLAAHLGLQVEAISGPPGAQLPQDARVHVAATSQSLLAFQKQPAGKAWLSRRLAVAGSSLFVTGFGGVTSDLDVVDTVLPGVKASIRPTASPHTYEVGRSSGMGCLEGLTFEGRDPADGVFLLEQPADFTPLISIDGAPCFVRANRNGTACFLVACRDVMDVDAAVPTGVQPIDRFLRFGPFLAYLRATFGSLCWTNESPAACLIIDDPLLRERYGFLDFGQLDSRLARSPFSLNIAFIPWNFRRTDRQVAERFKRADRRYSISIHGCDHTEAEFGSRDEAWLRRQARRALSRMEAHERLTGIAHNRVMVFPQGVFSKASLKALGDEGFLAAVNSTIVPVDATPGEITFSDFLTLAVTRFGGAPLFMRHYPDRLEKIALDLFLGRPALIVEHHGFFRRGYDEVARCVNFVNQTAPGIHWTDLDELCQTAFWTRENQGRMHVRAFSAVVRLRNRQNERTRFQVERTNLQDTVESVTWNGRTVDCHVQSATATCDLVLEAGESGVLRFQHAPNRGVVDDAVPTLTERLRVFARRRLCEVRDNYLDRSQMLTELAKAGRNLLPRV